MMQISYSPEGINEILNAPGVREEHFPPGVLADHPDAQHDASFALRQGGFSVLGDRMGWLFNKIGVGTYEGHSAILPEKRGPATLSYFNQCMDAVFFQTDCMEVFTRCPVDSKVTNAIAERLHMVKLYTAKCVWGGTDMNVYSLPVQVWASQNGAYKEKGHWLHDEFDRNGALHEDHEDDPMHFQYAGLAIEMGLKGWPHKGAHIYNTWAAMNSYDPVEIMCLDPLIMRTMWRNDKSGGQIEFIDYKVAPEGLERL